MKGQKTRKLSIRWKILNPVSLIILLLAVVLGANSYAAVSSGMIEMGVEEAAMAANIAVSGIDGDLLARMSKEDAGSEAYDGLMEGMAAIRDVCGIRYLYTLYTDGSRVYYGIDTDTENPAAFGELFDSSYEEMQDVFAGKPYVQDYIDRTELGDLITAYMPVRDSQGNVVSAVGCDYDASSVTERIKTMMARVFYITLFSFAAALVVVNVIVAAIIRGLGKVNGKLYELVNSKGDLTRKLDIRTGDETELIADNVNALLLYIREIMLNISRNSSQLNDSSKSVAKHLSDAELSITDVSATMQQMSAAMEQTNASLSQINESVNGTCESVEEIYVMAREGSGLSEEIMQKASDICRDARQNQECAREQAKLLAVSVEEKIRRSAAVEEINELTANIINITEQTTLLSLNANIEAARAGEAGRGFAVVADEIGRLASDSAEAATEIRRVSASVIEAVKELAGEAHDMLTFMDDVAMSGYVRLLETCGSYQEDVGNLNRMMREFASGSEQIKDNMDRIRESMESVKLAVDESTAGVTNVTEKSVDLTGSVAEIGQEAGSGMEIADELGTEVSRFRLE